MRIECSPLEVNADLLAYYDATTTLFAFARVWYWIGRAMILDRQYGIARIAPWIVVERSTS